MTRFNSVVTNYTFYTRNMLPGLSQLQAQKLYESIGTKLEAQKTHVHSKFAKFSQTQKQCLLLAAMTP